MNSAHYLSALLAQMDANLTLEEVRSLCFHLDVDYDNLGGETKNGRLRELILHLVRAERLPALIAKLRADRAEHTWPDVPPDLELYGSDPFVDAPPPRRDFEPETVRVPGGPFLMGSDGDHHTEAPRHTVDLPAFAIGLTPVTNEQYVHYLWATGGVAGPELLWDGNRPRDDMLDCPVLGVSWYDALGYCRWLNEATERVTSTERAPHSSRVTGQALLPTSTYTLPTEAQWEKAARGPDGRRFPWGDDWDDGRANANRDAVTPVRAFQPQSVYGCYDLVGNGREWTRSAWGLDPRVPNRDYVYPWRPDRRNDPDLPAAIRRVFRGGRATTPGGHRCSARGNFAPGETGPRGNRHGFRVVLTS